MAKVSVQEFVDHYKNLYKNGAIYLWGANCQKITKALTDSLYRSFKSATYSKTYYDNKFKEGAGKIGADCSGSAYPLSKADNTARGYYKLCTKKGAIANIPKNVPCLVFNKALTHVGAYMGDGTTIEMRSSKYNVWKETLKKSRWAYYGYPNFVDYSTTATSAPVSDVQKGDVLIKKYQTWLNDTYKVGINVDGDYGKNTKTATIKALQIIYNSALPEKAKIKIDGDYGPATDAAFPSVSKLVKNEGFCWILHIMMYVHNVPITKVTTGDKVNTVFNDNSKSLVAIYQASTRGLQKDGIPGPATVRSFF